MGRWVLLIQWCHGFVMFSFPLLFSSHAVLDLCATPGGWMQVVMQQVPFGNLVLGLNLVPVASFWVKMLWLLMLLSWLLSSGISLNVILGFFFSWFLVFGLLDLVPVAPIWMFGSWICSNWVTVKRGGEWRRWSRDY